MDFCELCDNMLYVKIKDENLINYCKNCNFSQNIDSNTSRIIIENNYEKEQTNYDNTSNSYIKYDPTLPRVNNIVCLNKKCSKDDKSDNEVIYTKYDNENMKFKYYCVYCDYSWNN